jgi:hypothetical protein
MGLVWFLMQGRVFLTFGSNGKLFLAERRKNLDYPDL